MNKLKLKNGLVHVYFGDGKGKTSAALGLGLRACGCGLRVCMLQFLKKSNCRTGELNVSGGLRNFKIMQLDQAHPMFSKKKINLPALKKKVYSGLRLAEGFMKNNSCDILILDEILNAVECSLIDEKEIIKLIRRKPKKIELVLTGRSASKRLLAHADYVSMVENIKHPFDKNIFARRGIEF